VAEYARAFGLGSPTGIDIAGEADGLVPDPDWKQETLGETWTVGDTYNFGIGQGYVAATPIQMLRAITAIANGGTLVTPRVVSEYLDSLGNTLETLTSASGTVPVDGANLQIVRDAMRQSVTSGVARNAAVAGVAVAGKTGTAEFGAVRDDGTYQTHGWFAGFAPAEDPEIAVVVFVESGSGGSDASPAAARIFDYYFNGGGPVHGPGDAVPVPDPSPVDVLDATETPSVTDAPATDLTEPTAAPAEPTPPPEPQPTSPPTATPVAPPTDSPTEAPQESAPPVAALPDQRRPNGGVP
jgi:membrane peptidoglycan carboxypeptidase